MKKKIVYEQPLNERMKNLLRLEHLFMEMSYHLKGPSEWDSRVVINTLLGILEVINKIDFISEVTKDLQHHTQTLERWQKTTEVNADRLGEILDQVENLIEQLSALEKLSLGKLSQHHLLSQVRQRLSIIGGTCRGDLPGYYHWLQKNPKVRQTDLMEWFAPLEPLKEALELDLYLIRNNVTTSWSETAVSGYFQSKLDTNVTYQIIQVGLPPDYFCYPEINGGKQRITIRFLEQSSLEQRPLQTEQNVNFELCYCML